MQRSVSPVVAILIIAVVIAAVAVVWFRATAPPTPIVGSPVTGGGRGARSTESEEASQPERPRRGRRSRRAANQDIEVETEPGAPLAEDETAGE